MSKRRGLSRLSKITSCACIGIVLTATGATAHIEEIDDGAIDNAKATHGHDLQHGTDEGHLPAKNPAGDGL